MTALAVCALLFIASPARADFSDHMQMLSEPRPMPPLVFADAGGAQHTLADDHGRYILLNIWATWCAPCAQEMPSLDALQARLGDRVVIVPLAEDRDAAGVAAFYKTHSLKHLPVAIDSAGMAPSALDLTGIPTTFLINPQGIEVARMEGNADWMSDDAFAFMDRVTRP